MISGRIIGFCAVLAAFGFAGCKRAAPAPPAPVGSATSGESLPTTVVEVDRTWGTLLVGGVQVDKSEFAKIKDDGHQRSLPGLTDALKKEAERTGQDGCVLRVDRWDPGAVYFSLLHAIEASPLGKRIYLDTGKGVVHVEQTPPTGRVIVARLEGERFVTFISEQPFGTETSEEEVRVERRMHDVEWTEMDGMDDGIAKHWRTHAKGAKRLMVRVADVQAFSDLAAFARAADRARRELPGGERFEIGIAPLIPRVERPDPPLPTVPVRLGPVKVTLGKRDVAVFVKVLRNKYLLFRRCYDDAATNRKNVHGNGVLTFLVTKNGQVLDVLFKGSLPRDAATCLRDVGRTISLPDGDSNANIDVEIEFTPPDGGT